MPDHSLNKLTTLICVFRLAIVDATTIASYAYPLLDRVRLLEVSVYPFSKDLSHSISGSTIRRKNNGDRAPLERVS